MNLFHKDLSQTQRENPNRGVRFRRMQVLVNCILMSESYWDFAFIHQECSMTPFQADLDSLPQKFH